MKGEKIDEKEVMSFIFTKVTADEMRQWVESGYFADIPEIFATALGMLKKVMYDVERDKRITSFDDIVLQIEIDFQNDRSTVVH